jgi:hypothetical protein
MRSLTTVSLALCAVALLAACPGGPGIPGRGGSSVNADACGNYADVNEAGRKLHAFLDATATLETTVKGLEVEVRTGCDAMAKELGIKPEGDNKAVCDAVLAELKKAMSVGIKADAKLAVEYTPAVCTVNIDAGVSAAAECEAKASGDVSVKCEGTCSGTCNGACDGKCEGSSGSGGDCAGQCDGTCNGSCSGGCEGSADVDASAECKAQAEAHMTAEMTCTEAKLEVTAEASVVVSKPDTDRVIAAIKAGMPHILTVQAKIKPLKSAVEAFLVTGKGVVDAGKDLAGQFKDQALCLTGQISAAASAMAHIEASFSFSVEVSASASASAGTN